MREDWVDGQLGDLAELNPKLLNKNEIDKKLKVQFLPMKLVEEVVNKIHLDEIRKFDEVQKKSYTYFSEGDVLFAKVTPCMENGKIAIAHGLKNDIGFGSSEFHVFRCSEVLLNNYLFYYIVQESFRRNAQHEMTGAVGLRRVPKLYLINHSIPLPPMPEQRAIVTKIETLFSDLDKGIADLKTAQAQLKVYRQAVLKKAFEGELTKEWREQQTNLPTAEELLEQIKEEREKHYEQQHEDWKKEVKAWEENGKEGRKPGKPKDIKSVEGFLETELKEMNKIPDFWRWVKLGNVFQVFVGSTPSRSKPEYWDNGEINWVSSGEVSFSSIFHTKEKITNEGLKNTSTSIHPIGTVMLAMIGEGKTRGQAGILEIDACHNQNTAAIRVSQIGFVPKFLFHYLFLKYERNRGIGSGNNQKALNQSRIMNFDYPLCSIQEQHQIVKEIESRLSVCDKIEQTITQSLKQSQALRQSILKKAFEGSLLSETEIATCKAEKDYEPASVLLERIKADKNKQ